MSEEEKQKSKIMERIVFKVQIDKETSNPKAIVSQGKTISPPCSAIP